MKKSKWTKEQVKMLLTAAKDSRNRSKVFADVAAKTNRRADSVRNYYYKLIDGKPEHAKQVFDSFTKIEIRMLLRDVILGYSRGESVRGVCLRLGGNDKTKMLRLQNKYRAICVREPERINELAKELEEQGYFVKNPLHAGNVIKMPANYGKQEKLSDSDINNLFMGLVRLIKKSAADEQVKGLNSQIEKLKSEIERLKASKQAENEIQ